MGDLYGNPFSPGGGPTGGGLYGGPNTSFTDFYYGQNPEYAYRNALNNQQGGYNPYSRLGQFEQSQYGNQYQQYGAVAPQKGAGYTFQNYLDENGGTDGLKRQFQNLDPSQRGLNTSAYGNKMSWVGF